MIDISLIISMWSRDSEHFHGNKSAFVMVMIVTCNLYGIHSVSVVELAGCHCSTWRRPCASVRSGTIRKLGSSPKGAHKGGRHPCPCSRTAEVQGFAAAWRCKIPRDCPEYPNWMHWEWACFQSIHTLTYIEIYNQRKFCQETSELRRALTMHSRVEITKNWKRREGWVFVAGSVFGDVAAWLSMAGAAIWWRFGR